MDRNFPNLVHDDLIIQIYFCLQKAFPKTEWGSEWQLRYLLKKKGEKQRLPDGVVDCWKDAGNLAIEAEINRKSTPVWESIIKTYSAAFDSKGKSLWYRGVLIVTINTTIRDGIINRIYDLKSRKVVRNKFFVCSFEDLEKGKVFIRKDKVVEVELKDLPRVLKRLDTSV